MLRRHKTTSRHVSSKERNATDGNPSVADHPVESSPEPMPPPPAVDGDNDDTRAAHFRNLRLAGDEMADVFAGLCKATEELLQSSLDLRTSCRRLLARIVCESRN